MAKKSVTKTAPKSKMGKGAKILKSGRREKDKNNPSNIRLEGETLSDDVLKIIIDTRERHSIRANSTALKFIVLSFDKLNRDFLESEKYLKQYRDQIVRMSNLISKIISADQRYKEAISLGHEYVKTNWMDNTEEE